MNRTNLMLGLLVSVVLVVGCNPTVLGAGVRWTNYPELWSSPKTYDWLVVKCQFNDVSSIPAGLDTDISQFLGLTGAGYGNIVDYFHDVSYN
jgi:hypothetical protein